MLIFFLIFFSFVLILFVLDSLRFGITPTSTSRKVREKILTIVPSGIEGPIADLGSGFGDFALSLHSHFGTSPIFCFEGATVPYLLSKILFFLRGGKRIKLFKQDFLKQNFGQFDLVFCYLYRGVMPKLSEKFKRELKPGSFVISHTFAIEDLKPKKIVYADDLYHTPIYLYQMDT